MYPIPGRTHRVEQSIRRSRFITTVAHAAGADAAHAFIDRIRRELPDATHHCWAFVAGPPGETAAVGLSDAGEPHGTAGRPMLETLLHSGVGEIVAVVTRYYGGVKLGKGGLGRAYSGGVALALETLPLAEHVDRAGVRLTVDYGALDPVRRLAAELGAEIRAEEYAEDVTLRVAVPTHALSAFEGGVAEITAGKGSVEKLRGE